jgi:hypothetical protein
MWISYITANKKVSKSSFITIDTAKNGLEILACLMTPTIGRDALKKLLVPQ